MNICFLLFSTEDYVIKDVMATEDKEVKNKYHVIEYLLILDLFRIKILKNPWKKVSGYSKLGR